MRIVPLHRIRPGRFGLWILLVTILVVASTITRAALLTKSFSDVDLTLPHTAAIFSVGFLYDLVNAVYFSLPFVLYLWLMPRRLFTKAGHKYALHSWFAVMTFMIVFNGVAEWLFWDEFHVRFNFIAVDYLVYTTEVIGNITQSYPLGWIIGAIVLLTAIICWIISSWIEASSVDNTSLSTRSAYTALYGFAFILTLFAVRSEYHHFSDNAYVNELAGNGLYDLFAAYRNNEISYDRFYAGIEDDSAFGRLRKSVKTREAQYVGSDAHSIVRKVVNEGEEKRLNVVLISVESFSADFMKTFGNEEGITPFLDSLAQESLLFTNLYATGTRTVRGLEALSLCVPPTPGQSIVRRPGNEDLFSIGKVFRDKGYATEYIYGGYSYFDNMGYFFSHNGYNVVDRSALNNDQIDYENIWGVADENLLDLALRELDQKAEAGPVFAHVMTTSNHRPFTYPEGRIDIPSHTNRSGAVKYTDYAIGRFIKAARKHDWFRNTIFVIVADHCASSAGKTELPVSKYHIPMLIYSPGNIEPGVMNRLMSQIDIGPTLLGILNFSYTSNFYGYDIFKLEPGRERAFISTYQSLGYLRDGKLAILSPQKKVESFRLSDKLDPIESIHDRELEKEAISWYQSASYSFRHGLMR
ncbi:MAG: LTA synthase family protein [Chryseolinea sp.]